MSAPFSGSGSLSATPSTARLFLLLFLGLNFLFLLTSSGRVRTPDELSADLEAESLATRGTTATPQAGANFYGKFDRAGQPQPPYGAAHALALVPWYAAGRALRAIVPGIPAQANDVALDAVVVASSATFAALAATLAFLILVQLGISQRAAIAATVMMALATPLFAYSSWLFSEPLTAALLLGAAAVLFRGRGQESVSMSQAVLGGCLLGIAIWVRATHVIAAPVFLLAILARDRTKGMRAVLAAGSVVAVFGIAYLLRNQYLFGNPLDFGYPATAEGGKNILTFETPIFTGLYGLLLSPGKSVLLFAPPILLAIAGLWKLARRDVGLAVVAGATPLVYLLFYSRYTQWEGGYCAGPRYMVPAVALLCLGLGPMLEDAVRWVRRSAVLLFLAGLSVQIITMATSFLEDQANGTYYDAHYNYRLDYSPLISMTRQLGHYVTSPQSAVLGRGFDRWFVFLPKAGVAHGTVAAFLIVEFAGLVFFALALAKTLRVTGTKSRTELAPSELEILRPAV